MQVVRRVINKDRQGRGERRIKRDQLGAGNFPDLDAGSNGGEQEQNQGSSPDSAGAQKFSLFGVVHKPGRDSYFSCSGKQQSLTANEHGSYRLEESGDLVIETSGDRKKQNPITGTRRKEIERSENAK